MILRKNKEEPPSRNLPVYHCLSILCERRLGNSFLCAHLGVLLFLKNMFRTSNADVHFQHMGTISNIEAGHMA